MESDTVQWQKGMMCIQDIFLHGNNVTASINSTDVNEFKNYCKHSLNILRAAGASLRYWVISLILSYRRICVNVSL